MMIVYKKLYLEAIVKRRIHIFLCLLTVSSIFCSVQAFSALELERAFSTGLFSGTKSRPKEIISFKFRNDSDEDLKNINIVISGRSLDAEIVKTIEVLEKGDFNFVQAKIDALRTDENTKAEFKVKAEAEGRVYEWSPEVSRIPPVNKRVHLHTHFHYDPVWIHTDGQRGYALKAIDLVNQYLDVCEKEKKYTFVLEQVPYLKPFWDTYPERRQDMWDAVNNSQLEMVTGSYIQPDESSVFGEGMIRNFQYGKLFQDEVMKCGPTTAGWQFDSFGHTPQYGQMLKKFGLNSFAFVRGGAKGFPGQYFWISPDGTEMFSFDLGVKDVLQDVFKGRVEVESESDIDMNMLKFMELEVIPDAMGKMREIFSVDSFYLPVGDDFMPPIPLLGMATRYWNNKYLYPQIRFSLPNKYYSDAMKQIRNNDLDQRYMTKDLNPVFMGCYSSRTDLKIANRLAEMTYLDAELLATIANKTGAKYPAIALDKALRELLYLEHHDAIPGTTNELSYLDILYGWREALNLSAEVKKNAFDYIAKNIDTSKAGEKDSLVVFNTTSFRRNDVVEVESDFPVVNLYGQNGEKVVFDQERNVNSYKIRFTAKDVPSMGYRVYFAERGAPEETVISSEGNVIENDYYSVRVDPERGAGIVELVDIAKGKNWAADSESGLMNSIYVYEDKGNLWGLDLSGGYSTAEAGADVRVEKGNTFSRIISMSKHPEFSMEQIIELQNGVKRVNFKTRIFDYKGQDRLFKLRFPVSGTEGFTPVYGERFAPIVRKPGEEFPADGWAALSRTFMLRTVDGEVPLGVPAIVMHRGDREAQKFAKVFMKALIKIGTPCVTFFDELSPDTTVDSLIYLGEPESHGELISKIGSNLTRTLHTINRRGMAALVEGERPVWIIGPRLYTNEAAVETLLNNIVQQKMIDFTSDMMLSKMPFKGTGSATVALINRGNNGYRISEDGVMELQLLRSSTGRPGGEAYERAFSKEDWNHKFEYSLIAGQGDWERANTENAAIQANRPLIAGWTDTHEGGLPADGISFFSVEPESALIVSSLKKVDNGIVEYSRGKEYKGTAIRIYNNSPESATATISSYFKIESAMLTDMMENELSITDIEDGIVKTKIGARSIETFVMELEGSPEEDVKLAGEKEPVQPVYASYWRHNDNIAPMGYQPVTVSFDPVFVEESGETEVELKIAADYIDVNATGRVELKAPEGWVVEPSSLDYDLAPRGYVIEKIKILPSEANPDGIVRAYYDNEGTEYYTSVAVGEIPVPDIVGPSKITLRTGEKMSVKMKLINRSDGIVKGEAVVISPIGTWEESPETLQAAISPFRGKYEIGPGSQVEYPVDVNVKMDALPGSYWFVLKLMADGEYVHSSPVEVEIQN